MTRSFMVLRFVVKDDERAFLLRNGRLMGILEPGEHALFDPRSAYTVETFKAVRAEFPAERGNLLLATHPALVRRHFEVVRAGADEVVLVSLDGEPMFVVMPYTTRLFWKTAAKLELERIDTEASPRLEPRFLAKLNLARMPSVLDTQIEAHEVGLLFVDGVLAERLPPGRHAFWRIRHTMAVRTFDLRPQPIEVTAQEILTKDRIGVRVTLTAFYRVLDPETVARAAADLATALYRLIQFAVREAIATRTLDDILAARDAIDVEVRAFVSARVGDLGVAVTELGVRDVILPGDVRALINKVIEAERLAKANLIRRQEETAATRSLLNTAKLMESNPILMRLKELEALEKLVEKVGRIDLHASGAGGGFEALLDNLYRLRADGTASGSN